MPGDDHSLPDRLPEDGSRPAVGEVLGWQAVNWGAACLGAAGWLYLTRPRLAWPGIALLAALAGAGTMLLLWDSWRRSNRLRLLRADKSIGLYHRGRRVMIVGEFGIHFPEFSSTRRIILGHGAAALVLAWWALARAVGWDRAMALALVAVLASSAASCLRSRGACTWLIVPWPYFTLNPSESTPRLEPPTKRLVLVRKTDDDRLIS